MKLKLELFLILFMTMQLSFAQEKTISGTVNSFSTVMPLVRVNIIVKGTSRGTQTDLEGKYSIVVNQGETLVFSFVGMKTVEITVGLSSQINVFLEKEIAALDEFRHEEKFKEFLKKNYLPVLTED